MSFEYLERNTAAIRERIGQAAAKAGREEPMLLVAVKYAEPEEIDYLHHRLGICDIGENRVQQLLAHYDAIDREGLNIHFIGTLQTNKVKYIIDKVCMIHSLDSVKLAAEIDKQAGRIGRIIPVLIEINSGREEQKGGVLPEDAEEFYKQLCCFSNIKVSGLMTMGPVFEDAELLRPFFRETKALFDKLNSTYGFPDGGILSMGMSDSYKVAIEEGSTLVRVGRKLFEKK